MFPGAGSPAPGIGVGTALYQQQQTAITRHPTAAAAATLTAFHQTQHSPHKGKYSNDFLPEDQIILGDLNRIKDE